MGAIQRIFGRDEKFYDLLEASATEAKNSASLLRKVLEESGQQKATEEALADLAQSRRTHKRITHEITEKLCKSFVTPLEREDIETLSSALHKISKNLEKIGERLTFCSLGPSAENVFKQVSMLERATEAVLVMVKALRKKVHVEKSRIPTNDCKASKAKRPTDYCRGQGNFTRAASMRRKLFF